jgi:hypothetical protein
MNQNTTKLLHEDGSLALYEHLVDEHVLAPFRAKVQNLFRGAELRKLTVADHYVILHQAHQMLDLEFAKTISRIRHQKQEKRE